MQGIAIRVGRIAGLVVSVLSVVGALGCDASSPASEQASAAQAPPAEPADLDPNSLRITFLGTGAPRPSLKRYGPSILVEAGDKRLLVDVSWGTRERLLQAGSFELITGLDHVLLTHLHFDHTIGLPDLWLTGWLYGRKKPLLVHGPTGTSEMCRHFREAYDWDINYRTTVGVHEDGSEFDARDIGPGVFYEEDGLKITAFEVEHLPIDIETRDSVGFPGQTLGFRIDFRGRSVVFSGDTRYSDGVVEHGKNVDVLIHETQVPSPDATEAAKLANVSLSVHTEPSEVGRVFTETRPRMAVYSHIIPPDVTSEELIELTPYDGPIVVAHDLMMLTIGDEIVVSDRPLAAVRSFEQSNAVR